MVFISILFEMLSVCSGVCMYKTTWRIHTMTVTAKGIDIYSKYQVDIICCILAVCVR